MTLRIIEATFSDGHTDSVLACLDDLNLAQLHLSPVNDSNQRLLKLVTDTDSVQTITDRLQSLLGGSDAWRLVVSSAEATIPALADAGSARTSREELYEDVARGAVVDLDFVVLTVLSVIVAWIGLNEANVAVIIGAMVIAPLLGPNLALSLGSALGDLSLIRRALQANGIGVGLTLALACLLGFLFEPNISSHEILSRTSVDMGDLGLALASGAAAALSITAGVSSTLVGVMVAIALMPPAVAAGLLLGAQHFELAGGALLLLITNVVCLNVASQLVLIWKGVRPRTWAERLTAATSVRVNLAAWCTLALVVCLAVFALVR